MRGRDAPVFQLARVLMKLGKSHIFIMEIGNVSTFFPSPVPEPNTATSVKATPRWWWPAAGSGRLSGASNRPFCEAGQTFQSRPS